MKYDKLRLSNQLCFPLYASSRVVMNLYKPFLDPLGLTYTQYITMMVLWERDEMTVKELGEKLFLDSGTLTPLLKKLEQLGLLRRERNPDDERSVVVSLTPKGAALKDSALEIPSKMADCIAIPQQDMADLQRLLNKILAGSR
ncbi:MAG: MarR family winged helix-turn-helix transcriptional regulator [Saccharofermentanales bacterium]